MIPHQVYMDFQVLRGCDAVLIILLYSSLVTRQSLPVLDIVDLLTCVTNRIFF